MATAKTQTKLTVTHTNDAESYAQPFGYKVIAHRYTLKGRLEYPKDFKAVTTALNSIGGVEYLEYNGWEVTLGWDIGHTAPEDSLIKGTSADKPGINPEWVEITQEAVNKFINSLIDTYYNSDRYPELKGKGIEPHVFIESLKPITEFDGERNGPLGDFRA